MKIHHLNCASMCPAAGRLLPSLIPEEIVCHCLMIESADGLILVDTGLSYKQLENPRGMGALNYLLNVRAEPQRSAKAQIRALGFNETDVRHIITTHLDDDHSGGIVDFPEAQIHSSNLEMNAVENPANRIEKMRYRHFRENLSANWVLHDFAQGENWFGFQGVRPLGNNPDLLLIPLIGHSFGHFGVAVRTKDGWLLHAGDAYYDHRELDGLGKENLGLSLLQTFIHSDYTSALHNRKKLRELRKTHPEVRIFCAHDKTEFKNFTDAV